MELGQKGRLKPFCFFLWAKARQALNLLYFGSLCDHPFGVSPSTLVYNLKNIEYDKDTGNIFRQPGCIYSAAAKITIGPHTWIGSNVGLITQNHDPSNPDKVLPPEPITIGSYCWIGMNAIILPGVVLGDYTTVGAGAVVTKSFPDGNCIIVGNPGGLKNGNCN